jgi:hypothetical protein
MNLEPFIDSITKLTMRTTKSLVDESEKIVIKHSLVDDLLEVYFLLFPLSFKITA